MGGQTTPNDPGDQGGAAEALDTGKNREFTRELLCDLHALERMVLEDRIESDVCRIGAEQELFIVDRDWMPAALSTQLLEALNEEKGDGRFTSELAQFNLEANLEPMVFGGSCLARLEDQVHDVVGTAESVAQRHNASIVLAGILPTLTRKHCTLDYMTPADRYRQLNETMTRFRGGPYDLRIKGRDEMMLRHDNVMLEACNTSFQVHLQVSGADFVRRYNVAQLIAGPALAAMTNSPLLFDRQLWSETRIALFQQGTDDRSQHLTNMRSCPPRVSFGARWLERSAVEVFEEDIARFRTIIGQGRGENAVTELNEGRVPKLLALRQHNGTVYRWNRPCYGISEGKPHLRIECRYIPAGPSIVDEVANTALWLGLIHGATEQFGDPSSQVPFGVARSNFLAAARSGLSAQFFWRGGKQVTAQQLLLEELIPMAREGLLSNGVDSIDVDRYLGVVEERVRDRCTGAHWLMRAHDALSAGEDAPPIARAAGLVKTVWSQQQTGEPVHRWPLPATSGSTGSHVSTVEQIMTTDLFTVHPDELIHLAAHVMDWKHVRHVPVEDDNQKLVGLISHRLLLRVLARQATAGETSTTRARDIMTTDVISVRPGTPTLDALELMCQHEISCVPVVDDDNVLMGILTERDLVRIAQPLMRKFLQRPENSVD